MYFSLETKLILEEIFFCLEEIWKNVDPWSTEMKNKKNSKYRVRKWTCFLSKNDVKYLEMLPVQFSTTLVFSSRNFNLFSIFDELSPGMKTLTKSQKKIAVDNPRVRAVFRS